MKFMDFVFETKAPKKGYLTLEEAKNLALQGGSKKEFIDFLDSEFAKKVSTEPYMIISTPKQILEGTFVFTRDFNKGKAIKIRYDGKVFLGGSQILTHEDKFKYFMANAPIKSDGSNIDALESCLLDKYVISSKFIEEKFDLDAVGFPITKRLKRGKFLFQAVDEQGNPAIHNGLPVDPIPFSGFMGFFDPDIQKYSTIVNLDGNYPLKGKMYLSDMLTLYTWGGKTSISGSNIAGSIHGGMSESELNDCEIHGKQHLEYNGSSLQRTRFTNFEGTLQFFKSNLSEAKIDLSSYRTERDWLFVQIGITDCKIDNLEISMEPFIKGNALLKLEKIKLSESKRVSELVINIINSFNKNMTSGTDYYTRLRVSLLRHHKRINQTPKIYDLIKDCDFSGIDLSTIDLDAVPMDILLDLANNNKNLNVDSISSLPRSAKAHMYGSKMFGF